MPDIAGWRREGLLKIPDDQRFEVPSNWLCEVLSPSTTKKDRVEKMPVYARYGVAFLWLVDPLARTLETYELQEGKWIVGGMFKDDDTVRVAPFQAITLVLSELWI